MNERTRRGERERWSPADKIDGSSSRPHVEICVAATDGSWTGNRAIQPKHSGAPCMPGENGLTWSSANVPGYGNLSGARPELEDKKPAFPDRVRVEEACVVEEPTQVLVCDESRFTRQIPAQEAKICLTRKLVLVVIPEVVPKDAIHVGSRSQRVEAD